MKTIDENTVITQDYKKICVQSVLIELAQKFPRGFKSWEGQLFLRDSEISICYYNVFFRKLVKKGWMKKTNVNKLKKEGSKGFGYLYQVNPEALPSEVSEKIIEEYERQEDRLKHIEESSFTRTDLENLAQAYIAIRGVRELETLIRYAIGTDKSFINDMLTIKKVDPEKYKVLGGDYLDSYLARKR
ncbi:hypothetical protein J4477_01510 [Candidatus Pacearchaeota archaeon]|nr:hypothetical protein [Candidatus Pacearchaeota archaeon]